MIIYKAINKINSKVYIGQTINSLEKRIVMHLRTKSGAFPAALQKYGIQSFEFLIIDQAASKEILEAKERYWILQYKSKSPNGYNLTDGGDGGFKICEETCKKLSDAHKGKHPTEETRKKISASMLGKKHPDRAGKNSPSFGKKRPDTAARNKIGVGDKSPMWGKHPSEETRRKLSELRTGEKNHNWGKTFSKEYREKLSRAKTGEKHPMFGRKRPDVALRNKLRAVAIRGMKCGI